ncbi:MAG: hypothetical protein P8047_17160 [Gammaproteobacteria bacterium]
MPGKLWIGVLLLVLGWVPAAQADDTDFCQSYKLDAIHHQIFPQMADSAEAVVNQFCSGNLTNRQAISEKVVQLSVAVQDRFKSGGAYFFPIKKVNTALNKTLTEFKEAPNFIPMNLAQGSGIKFDGRPFKVDDENKATCNQVATANHAADCRAYILAYADIYNFAHLLIQKQDTAPVLKYLNMVEQDWDNYYQKSRSQTMLERLINSYFWRQGKKPGQFLSPPDSQWIVLHPSVVIENVKDAVAGNRTKEGLMLEVAGWNRWRRDKWYQLSGASLVAVYSDRANVNDWGYGMALYFGNVYTIGAVDHDGKTGVFISVDVLVEPDRSHQSLPGHPVCR